MRKRLLLPILLTIPWALPACARTCPSLINLPLPDGVIDRAEAVPSGSFTPPEGKPLSDLPAFCRVRATLKPSADSAVVVELWMPESGWNGRLEGTGNGGFAGKISYGALRRRPAPRLRGGQHRYGPGDAPRGHRCRLYRPARAVEGLGLSCDPRHDRGLAANRSCFLRSADPARLLCRLLHRRGAGVDGSSALSGRLRRDCERGAGAEPDRRAREHSVELCGQRKIALRLSTGLGPAPCWHTR